MPNSASIVVPTRSGQFALDMAHAAVIVVDMQNDFGSPGGMFERGGVDISGIRAVIPPTARVLTQTRQAGGRIIYLKAGVPVEARSALLDSMSDFLSGFPPYAAHINSTVGQQVSAPDGSDSCVMVRDTWNTAIVDELTPEPDDLVIYKPALSGFYDTDLHERLQALAITDLIFTGCTTSVCVESTLRDAVFRHYRCLLLQDCVAEPVGADLTRSNHDATLHIVDQVLGWVSDSTTLVTAVSGSRQLVDVNQP
jgi:ureidoacrylate peracid hydrolase